MKGFRVGIQGIEEKAQRGQLKKRRQRKRRGVELSLKEKERSDKSNVGDIQI